MNKDLKKKLKDLKEINKKKYNEYYNVDELEKNYGISKQRLEKILRTKEYFKSIKNF
jgi:hypothetical protein